MANMVVKYTQVLRLLDGVDTREDALKIISKVFETESDINLMTGLISMKKYSKVFSNAEMMNYMDMLDKCGSSEDAYIMLGNICDKTEDETQLTTFRRIANSKSHVGSGYKYNDSRLMLTKKCPHCGHNNTKQIGTMYVICGYDEVGYDWMGCGHDWCFKCCKKLCKSWENNSLYIIENRKHNDKCCKKHAKKVGSKFPDDYCVCGVVIL